MSPLFFDSAKSIAQPAEKGNENRKRSGAGGDCNLLRVKSRIEIVDVFLIQPFLCQPQRLAEALEVHDLPGTQEADGIADVRVIGKAENVVIGNAGLLLCCDGVRTTALKAGFVLFQNPLDLRLHLAGQALVFRRFLYGKGG